MNIWSIAAGVAVFALVVSPVSATSFDDVGATHWAAPAINAITDAGIMEGCGGSFFCPYAFVTREELSVWLARVEHYSGGVVLPPATGHFLDVPAEVCKASWIQLLLNDGLTGGCDLDPPLFCPRKTVSRAEMAVFVVRLLHGVNFHPIECQGDVYADVKCAPDGWADDWIEQVHRDGLSGGCAVSPLRYCPLGAVNRAQAALFLVRVMCKRYQEMCPVGNAPEGGPEVVDVFVEETDEGHELVAQ